ncbi:MAG: hypothetical protein Aurels2KO_39230 [Aureliella sp.]
MHGNAVNELTFGGNRAILKMSKPTGASIMHIEIPDEISQKMAAILGTKDQLAIARIVERVANDEQLLKSLMVEELSELDALAVREGIKQADAGQVRSLEDFDVEFRARNGFATRSQP